MTSAGGRCRRDIGAIRRSTAWSHSATYKAPFGAYAVFTFTASSDATRSLATLPHSDGGRRRSERRHWLLSTIRIVYLWIRRSQWTFSANRRLLRSGSAGNPSGYAHVRLLSDLHRTLVLSLGVRARPACEPIRCAPARLLRPMPRTTACGGQPRDLIPRPCPHGQHRNATSAADRPRGDPDHDAESQRWWVIRQPRRRQVSLAEARPSLKGLFAGLPAA